MTSTTNKEKKKSRNRPPYIILYYRLVSAQLYGTKGGSSLTLSERPALTTAYSRLGR